MASDAINSKADELEDIDLDDLTGGSPEQIEAYINISNEQKVARNKLSDILMNKADNWVRGSVLIKVGNRYMDTSGKLNTIISVQETREQVIAVSKAISDMTDDYNSEIEGLLGNVVSKGTVSAPSSTDSGGGDEVVDAEIVPPPGSGDESGSEGDEDSGDSNESKWRKIGRFFGRTTVDTVTGILSPFGVRGVHWKKIDAKRTGKKKETTESETETES